MIEIFGIVVLFIVEIIFVLWWIILVCFIFVLIINFGIFVRNNNGIWYVLYKLINLVVLLVELWNNMLFFICGWFVIILIGLLLICVKFVISFWVNNFFIL